MKKRRNENKIFTLVKLLIVAVIAVLIGVLLPALNKVQETAYSSNCMSNNNDDLFPVDTSVMDYHWTWWISTMLGERNPVVERPPNSWVTDTPLYKSFAHD